MAQRVIEGWIFDNPRSGYPFGSNFLDYPGSDSGNLLVLKLLGLVTDSPYAAVSLYFLAGFAVTFVCAYGAMRAFGLHRPFALAGAMLFNFVPFHFLRFDHLFYTWYFVAPLFFHIALRIANASRAAPPDGPQGRLSGWLAAACLLALGCFGVYYAAFGLILLGVVFLAGLLGPLDLKAVRLAALAICLVVLGVLANVAPNVVHKYRNGPNPEVAQRSAVDAELYAFKLVQLVYPRPDHRSSRAGNMTKRYNETFPLVNENFTSSLGAVGAAGFLGMFLLLCAVLAGRKVDRKLQLVALLSFVLFMFGTIGGFGSLFAQLVTSALRGWSRISIFIAFGALLFFFMVLQALCRRFPGERRLALAAVAAAVTLVGLYDQTTTACRSCIAATQTRFERDSDFVAAIERSLAPGSAVYQLPYMPFPEVPNQVRLASYDLASGVLNSRSLKWSYAGMKGRNGDGFFRALAQEPVEKQIKVIRRLGFAGVYIDRRGYADNGQAIVQRFTEALGHGPAIERADKEIVFFPLGPGSTPQAELAGLSDVELAARAGFIADRHGLRYEASLAQGIDFKRPDYPIFVRDIAGLSVPEAWGRWTDASLAPALRIDFAAPLPRRFTLVLDARPFGPNAGRELIVRMGSHTLRIKLQDGPAEYRQVVDLADESVSRIELVPPQPTSPQELGQNGDQRKLGIGIARLAIE
ncbi:sugar translocase [Massilia sp. Dwa41.01b]|nr:sugar translocase [Massilia sp. Dwa41.01b]